MSFPLSKVLRKFAPFRLDWLQVEVSARCNASCIYCAMRNADSSRDGGLISSRTFGLISPEFRNIGLVFLQGWGEPLLHPEFWTMVGQVKAAGSRAGFTTNATLLDRSRLLPLIESGVDIMAVSLAGARAATHNRFRPGCDFNEINSALMELKGLKRERRTQKPAVHIAFMLLRTNWRELEALVNLASRWDAAQIICSNLIWMETEGLQEESVLMHPEFWGEIKATLARAGMGACREGIGLHCHGPAISRPRPECTENVRRSCFVSHTGDVSPCVFTNFSFRAGESSRHFFMGRMHQGRPSVFGNVHGQALREIWHSAPARAFRNRFARRLEMDDPGTAHLPEPCRQCYKLLEGD